MASASRSICMNDNIRDRHKCIAIEQMKLRISDCRDYSWSNCIGTALYIAGQIPDEIGIGIKWAYAIFLKDLRKLEVPVEGCIVAWHERTEIQLPPLPKYLRRIEENNILSKYRQQNQELYNPRFTMHMGVVTCLEPLLVTNRISMRGRFIENQPISDINSLYPGHDIGFYLPKALENSGESP